LECLGCGTTFEKALNPTGVCLACGSVDLRHWASKAEWRRWCELQLQARCNYITGLERQVGYPIRINGIKVGVYRADFVYKREGRMIVEDCKGVSTPLYRFKRRCIAAQYGIDILETKPRRG